MAEDLPDELLLRILDLLSQRELICAAPHVCLRWRRLSLDRQLWRERVCNIWWDSDAAAVEFFGRGPALRSVGFQRRVGGGVLRCLAAHCAALTSLSLHGAQRLSLRTLRALARGCEQLRLLHVSGEVLSCRRRARQVALMPRLETLIVHGCHPLQLRELGAGCAALRRLEVGAGDVRLHELGAPLLRRLRGLVLRWNSVSGDLAHCARSLERLTLDYYDDCTRPDAALAEDLRPLEALTHVDARFLSARPQLLRALLRPLLRSLTLSWCTTLDDDLLLLLCRRCPLLEDLDLCHCDLLTSRGLAALWRLRHLRRLCLTDCEGLGGGAAAHLARCRGLQELNVDDVDLARLEPGVVGLLQLSRMRVLVVRAWTARDLIPWEALPKAFPHLRILELGEWMSLDATLPEALKAALPAAQVSWYISWELREGQDSVPEDDDDAAGNPATQSDIDEPDMDLFVFHED